MASIRVGPILLGTPALAGAGGDRRAGTCASPWPESVRTGLQNDRAPASICMRIHPHIPLHVQSHMPISARSIRTYVRIRIHHMHPRASRIRFPINIVPGHVPVPGPPSAANKPSPGRVRPRRSWGLLWQNRVKIAPSKLMSSLFFCPLRVLWKKCRFPSGLKGRSRIPVLDVFWT